tara:strand:- start:342 stop:722 length:381 start_codon:yes stop_codon:yes gene_type:complete
MPKKVVKYIIVYLNNRVALGLVSFYSSKKQVTGKGLLGKSVTLTRWSKKIALANENVESVNIWLNNYTPIEIDALPLKCICNTTTGDLQTTEDYQKHLQELKEDTVEQKTEVELEPDVDLPQPTEL